MALILDGTLGIAITGDSTITQNFTIPQNLIVGSGGSISTNNGSVDKVLNVYGGNNVVVGGVSTNVGFGLCLEASRTGRTSTARFAQISLGNDASDNGSILFYTAPSGSGVSERMRINSSGHVTAPNTPAFAAFGLGNAQVNSYANDLPAPLLFSTVGINTGSFYNSSTGRFTAPVAGAYYFSASLLVDNNVGTGQVSSAQFYKNGVSTTFTCYNQSPVGGYYTPMSQSCVLLLNANDYVNVQGLSGYIHTGSESAFTGFLIG